MMWKDKSKKWQRRMKEVVKNLTEDDKRIRELFIKRFVEGLTGAEDAELFKLLTEASHG